MVRYTSVDDPWEVADFIEQVGPDNIISINFASDFVSTSPIYEVCGSWYIFYKVKGEEDGVHEN